jgi:anti-sigma B factor antagonist
MTQLVESGRRQVIVDLGEVELVDSSGIGALINSTRQVRRHGGDLRLARPNRRMQVLLDVTYLHDLFRTYDDVDKALTDT